MANSDNYMSKFKPESHFFIAPASLTQVSSQAFGPVSDAEFRLTSKFSTSGSKAFAICKGIVLVQPQTGNNNKVNVILRPYTQPIMGFNIKYFIYRGLNKSDFFNGEQMIAKGADSSDFINKVNTSFLSFHNAINPNAAAPAFLAKYIGYDPVKQPENLMLSDFFFKESEYVESGGEFIEQEGTAYELPVVELGASLGNFAAGECGIDIVLNYGDYKLPLPNDEFVFDLAYARAAEAKIQLPADMDAFQKKLKREHIFQFLDAAAYFGFHSENGTVKIEQNGTKQSKKGLDIYTDVIAGFYTKNKVYIYIQSDRTRSYNFYGNYNVTEGSDHSLKLGRTAEGLVSSAYKTEGWPLIIDDTARVHSGTRNQLFLQFVIDDNNVNAMLYGQVAQIDSLHQNNFCNADMLKIPAGADGIPGKLTSMVTLSNLAAGTGSEKKNVASFNILLYQGKRYDYVVGQIPDRYTDELKDATTPIGLMDDIFDLIATVPLLASTSNTGYNHVSSQKMKLVNHYYNNTQIGISAVQSVIVNDIINTGKEAPTILNRVSYITETVDVLRDSTTVLSTISSDTKSTPSIPMDIQGNDTYTLPEPFYFDCILFTDGTQLINGLVLKAKDQSVPGKKIIGLTKEENELLGALQVGTNSRIALLRNSDDQEEFISVEGTKYFKNQAALLNEDATGNLQLLRPSSEITVYSLDLNYYCSRLYSEYMIPELPSIRGDIYNDEIKLV